MYEHIRHGFTKIRLFGFVEPIFCGVCRWCDNVPDYAQKRTQYICINFGRAKRLRFCYWLRGWLVCGSGNFRGWRIGYGARINVLDEEQSNALLFKQARAMGLKMSENAIKECKFAFDRTTKPRTVLEQAEEASELARKFFAAGDMVGGIAAIQLAAQLVQLARIQERWKSA